MVRDATEALVVLVLQQTVNKTDSQMILTNVSKKPWASPDWHPYGRAQESIW